MALDSSGRAVGDVDLFGNGGSSAFAAGETHLFQFWFTDPSGAGAGFSSSDALRVTFVD